MTAATLTETVTGLAALTTYDINVVAENAFGFIVANRDLNYVAHNLNARTNGVPFASTGVAISQASGSVSVVATWTPPVDHGGFDASETILPIDEYHVYVVTQAGSDALATASCSEYSTSLTGTSCTLTMDAIKTLVAPTLPLTGEV